ncbi:6-phosphogluconate dehydrogenase C-terminal domain-like protein [Xylaria palmicola]|nr:6-phosphogluconate dehydrogenase C-terminal domain-like protein [Xylaria palmicola]
MTAPLARIGIVSIGDMGMGIARLLAAHGFSMATNCKGRSDDTIDRARSANVEMYGSDEELAAACDVILSVVPPRDAAATAQRIVDAVTIFPLEDDDEKKKRVPLIYADLNAVAPSTARSIAAFFEHPRARGRVHFVDGAIIGGPPAPKPITGADAPPGSSSSGGAAAGGGWHVPSIPLSGPYRLSDAPGYGAALTAALNARHVADEVGVASGLKMCFASLTKGFTSLAVQSLTTARRLGVLGELQDELRARAPAHWAAAERGVVAMAPKAYRWVREMEEIALTFDEEGGFPPDLFHGVAGVYRSVAEDTVLGLERVGKRTRGTDVEDMAAAVAEGLEKKRKKND